MSRILLVENQTKGSHLVAQSLGKSSYKIDILCPQDIAGQKPSCAGHDLVILNEVTYSRSNLELLELIRARAPEAAILLIGRDIKDRELAWLLDAGADDCINHTFGEFELAARVRTLLRIHAGSQRESKGLEVGLYRADFLSRTVSLKGGEVPLTTKEFDIASVLFRNLDRLVPRSALNHVVVPRDTGTQSRSLDTHIRRIRRKLELSRANGLILETVYGRGYLLCKQPLQANTGAQTSL